MANAKRLKTEERTEKTPSCCTRCLQWISTKEFLKNDYRCNECNALPNHWEDKKCDKCPHIPHVEECKMPVTYNRETGLTTGWCECVI